MASSRTHHTRSTAPAGVRLLRAARARRGHRGRRRRPVGHRHLLPGRRDVRVRAAVDGAVHAAARRGGAGDGGPARSHHRAMASRPRSGDGSPDRCCGSRWRSLRRERVQHRRGPGGDGRSGPPAAAGSVRRGRRGGGDRADRARGRDVLPPLLQGPALAHAVAGDLRRRAVRGARRLAGGPASDVPPVDLVDSSRARRDHRDPRARRSRRTCSSGRRARRSRRRSSKARGTRASSRRTCRRCEATSLRG